MFTLAVAILFLAIVPGPGVLAVVARAVTHGFRSASFFTLGIVFGDLIFLLMAILGLAYIAELLGSFFVLIKVAGGAYLIVMGISLWRGAHKTSVAKVSNQHPPSDFLTGLAITLGNPKVIVFYASLLPSLLDLTSFSLADITLTAIIVSVVLASVLLGYALVAIRSRDLIRPKTSDPIVRRMAGGTLVGVGAGLLGSAE